MNRRIHSGRLNNEVIQDPQDPVCSMCYYRQNKDTESICIHPKWVGMDESNIYVKPEMKLFKVPKSSRFIDTKNISNSPDWCPLRMKKEDITPDMPPQSHPF